MAEPHEIEIILSNHMRLTLGWYPTTGETSATLYNEACEPIADAALPAGLTRPGWIPIADHDGSDTPVDLWRLGERLTDFSWGERGGTKGWFKKHGHPEVTTWLMSAPSHFMPSPAEPHAAVRFHCCDQHPEDGHAPGCER